MKPILLIPVIFAAIAGLLLGGLFAKGPEEEVASALAGLSAPTFVSEPLTELPSFDGATLADGEVKLVNFWASWCPPCRAEHPYLTQLSKVIPVYGVNYKDNDAQALKFLSDHGNPYQALIKDGGRMGLDWGIIAVPETFVIDGDGTVLYRMAGPVLASNYEATLGPVLAAEGISVELVVP